MVEETKQVNFRFNSEIIEMLEKLVDYYSSNDYMKYSKTAIMQNLIFNDYKEKIENKE